jgi:hypothetical protein
LSWLMAPMIVGAFALLFCFFSVATSSDLERADAKLLIGAWVSAPPDGCAKRYHFGADGSLLVTSRDEVLTGTFMAETVDAAERVTKITRIVVSFNGLPYCRGRVLNSFSNPKSVYAIWESPVQFRLCMDQRSTRCIGRFRRP